MIKRAFLIATAIAALAFSVQAAIIGTIDNRIPLADAAKACPKHRDPRLACGLSEAVVQQIAQAGMHFICDGHFLNAWYLDFSGKAAVYSNAHAFFTREGVQEDIRSCKVRPYSALDRPALGIVPGSIEVGPQWASGEISVVDDRSRFELTEYPDDLHPLAVLPLGSAIKRGAPLYLATIDLVTTNIAMIQRCNVRQRFKQEGNFPGAIVTDCDVQPGNSAGLFFEVRTDKKKVQSIRPVALTVSVPRTAVDGTSYGVNTNSARAALLDGQFPKFEGTRPLQ